MFRFVKRFKTSQKGFTLIELLVVVAILGVLAAVAIPNVTRFMGSGKVEAAGTELSNIQTAVVALMKDADVNSLTQGTFSNSQDFQGGTGLNLSSYVMGSLTQVHGTYSINADGSVSQTDFTP